MKHRLDQALVNRGLVKTRSQAVSYIRLGKVTANGQTVDKPGYKVGSKDEVKLAAEEQYVSRAALKLASVASELGLDFRGKVVLDVGSSTGGFTDFALRHGAERVIAVDVGTDQLHPKLRGYKKIELHEKTDIRSVRLGRAVESSRQKKAGTETIPKPHTANYILLTTAPDIIVVDVSFISLREVLPHISSLMNKSSELVPMVKPQFEAGAEQVHKGVIKNDSIRRNILKDFELWAKDLFIIVDKADSKVGGAKGNLERFYLLKKK